MKKSKLSRNPSDDAKKTSQLNVDVQFSESIKSKLNATESRRRREDLDISRSSKPSYANKYKAKKVADNTSSNVAQKSKEVLPKKSSKKGILKNPQKYNFIRNYDSQTELIFLRNQRNSLLQQEAKHKKDFLIAEMSSDESYPDESLEYMHHTGHFDQFESHTARYAILMDEINYYKRKVQLLQQENSNMHFRVSMLEEKLKEKNKLLALKQISRSQTSFKLPDINEQRHEVTSEQNEELDQLEHKLNADLVLESDLN